ncbi:ROK family protein [Candidatus Wolfebacteria bacterium]|nr:ROK family protein [Candidatus Wolfebacteria bacterium]
MKNKFYLGIDIGGTKIRGILLNKSRNQRLFAFQVKTPKNRKSFLEILEKEVRKILQKRKIIGIGIGLPGIVDVRRGLFIKAPNLPFLNGWQAKNSLKDSGLKQNLTMTVAVFCAPKPFWEPGKNIKTLSV